MITRLIFDVHIKPGWQLYAPNQDLSGTPSMELNFADSSFSAESPFNVGRKNRETAVALFDNAFLCSVFRQMQNFRFHYLIKGTVPARVFGSLNYYYGKADSFYSGNYAFNATLEGGVNTTSESGSTVLT